MARYTTTVRTGQSADQAFAYLADLRNFAAWDPGVRSVRQVAGTGGGEGTEFDVRIASFPRDMTLRYRTLLHDAPSEVLVRADTPFLSSEDRITVSTDGSITSVTYDADLRLKGPLMLMDPGLRLVFGRIGDRAAGGLRRALDAIGDPNDR